MRGVLGLLLVFLIAIIFNSQASASTQLSITQQITVTASVAPMRYVVVDASTTKILSVTSNTSDAIMPVVKVGSLNGKTIDLSDSIRSQYDQILKSHPDFGVGEIRPDVITTKPNLISKVTKNGPAVNLLSIIGTNQAVKSVLH